MAPFRPRQAPFLNCGSLSTGSTISLVCAILTLVFMLQGWIFSFDHPDDVNTPFAGSTRRRLREELQPEAVFTPEDWGSFHERHADEIRELERSFQQLQNADGKKLSEAEMAAMQLAGEIVFPGGVGQAGEEPPQEKPHVQTHAEEVLKKLREEEEKKNEELTKRAEQVIVLKQIQSGLKKSSGEKGGRREVEVSNSGKKSKEDRAKEDRSKREIPLADGSQTLNQESEANPQPKAELKQKEVQVQDLSHSIAHASSKPSPEKDDRPRSVPSKGQPSVRKAPAERTPEAEALGTVEGQTGVRKLQPKTMILTANEPRPCKLPRGFEVIMKAVKNKIDYSR